MLQFITIILIYKERCGVWGDEDFQLYVIVYIFVVAHLGNSTVVAGTRHSIRCTVSNYESNELQYEFLNARRIVQPRSESNEYIISPVQVEDAGDGYVCRVYDGNSNIPLATAQGTLRVTSIIILMYMCM